MDRQSRPRSVPFAKTNTGAGFGIVKEAMGFRQFHLRGIDKVNNEWLLLMSAYNLKILANLVK
jgi:hypothetical protein